MTDNFTTDQHKGEPLQLPAAGDSTPTQRVGGDHGHGTTLSLKEAAERLGIHEQTVRRAVKAGRVPGAHTVPHGKGEQWRVPVASLEAIRPQAAQQAQQDSDLVRELQAELIEVRTQLAVQRALADERDRTITELSQAVRALGAGRVDTPATPTEPAKPVGPATEPRAKWWQRYVPPPKPPAT